MSIAPLLAAAGALIGAPASAEAADRTCDGLLPAPVSKAPVRPLEPEDLVRLRDIGPVDATSSDARNFTLSPDGRRVAFQIRRADPAGNAYCLAMVVLDLRPGAMPHIVDSGGEFLRVTFENGGKMDYPTGVARTITPRWSDDGQWIYYLKRQGGRTQVWRARVDGHKGTPVTRSQSDVEDFALAADGAVIFSTRPSRDAALRALAAEGRRGFHFDERFAPSMRSTPFVAGPLARRVEVQDSGSGAVRLATSDEEAQLARTPIAEVAWREAVASDGRRAYLEVPSATFFPSRGRLVVQDAKGRTIRCEGSECADVSRPWWTAEGRVRFFRREGWAGVSTAIYEWAPGPSAPRRLYVTDDLLVDCSPQGDALLCLREGSLVPRRLERLDPVSGAREILFDPNPEFAHLRLGRAERLHYKNVFGLETIADLVLPTDYRPGSQVPLVVVQYDTRGFLRGGTGDDYPIQAFANRGYAVLSVSRPRMIGLKPGSADVVALERANLAGFAHRRSVFSSIEAGVQIAIERGIADPKRLGLTGMSDGATIANWAALHSSLFSAMAISQCCFDESFPSRVGLGAARHFAAVGYPRISERDDAFWNALSLVRNAGRVETPMLLQIADAELMSALPTFTALSENNAPVDMYVFPDEQHVKWQPAHRLAIYRRALDWFDFWLNDIRSPDPERHVEISRWMALRRSSPGHCQEPNGAPRSAPTPRCRADRTGSSAPQAGAGLHRRAAAPAPLDR